MEKVGWLDDIEKLLPSILRITKSCDESFQQDCFRMLLQHALSLTTSDVDDTRKDSSLPHRGQRSQDGVKNSPALQRFLEGNGITLEDLTSLVDPVQNSIIHQVLDKRVADVQRKLACLLSVLSLLREGRFFVPDQALREECRANNAYDSNNYTAYMKRVTFGASKVFMWEEASNGWAISRPGEQYIAKQVFAMLGRKNEG